MHCLVAKQASCDAMVVSDLPETGGQRIRARLALHASNRLASSRDDACSLACIALLLHNASLIYDDLLGLPIELALMSADRPGTLAVAKRAADSFAIEYQIYDDLLEVRADTVRGSSVLAINIVQVLHSSHAVSDYNASELVLKLGLQHLMSAASARAGLPCQSGRFHQQLAIEWHTRLTGRCLQ